MNADRIASSYRWLEYAAFGLALEQARFDFIARAAGARRVLILGEGDGRFLARLLGCNQYASVAVVESSARMIQVARERVPPAELSRVEFHHVDAVSQALPPGPFDLAVTHFFHRHLELPRRRSCDFQGKHAALSRRRLAGKRISGAAQRSPQAACPAVAARDVQLLFSHHGTQGFEAPALSPGSGPLRARRNRASGAPARPDTVATLAKVAEGISKGFTPTHLARGR
jgi:SAM-dependent methyltransferase